MDTDFAAASMLGSIAVAAGVVRADVCGLMVPGASSAAVGPQSARLKIAPVQKQVNPIYREQRD
jgi:hypothetical protein